MVTRFTTAVTRPTSAQSVSSTSKSPSQAWALPLVLCCVLPIGCQSTRVNSRTDSLASHLSDNEEEREGSQANKRGLSSFFTRWWSTDSKDEAYDLGLPRVEEDYVGLNSGNNGKISDKPTPTSPAEKKKNQFARKGPQDSTVNDEGLSPEQRELYRRQMQAMRRLGLNNDELSEILAAESHEGDLLDEIVQLPPVTPKTSPPPLASQMDQGDTTSNSSSSSNSSSRFKLSDDSTPPAPAAISNLPPAPPSADSWSPSGSTPPQTTTAASPAQPPSTTNNNLVNTPSTNTPSTNNTIANHSLITPATQSLPAAPVQSASGLTNPSDNSSLLAGPYFENDAQKTSPTSWESDTRQAINKLQERLAQDKNLTSKERLNLEARLRLMQLAANDMDAAMNPSQAWNKDAEQWFRSTLFSVHEAIALTGPESPNQRYSLVAKHHRDAAQHLLSLSDLEVTNVAFCTEVLSYGQVKKFPANALTANEEIILYCEFNNFAALKVHDGFETEFEARYEIVDLQNNRIYEEKLPTDRQTSANRRRDYFIAYQMYLPKDIAPGHYRLKLNVKDVKAGKFGQGLVEFQIVK